MVTQPKSNVDENYDGFAESYTAKYDEDPKIYTAESFDALNIIITAIRNSDGSRDGIKNALYEVQNYPGASGPTSFDEFGEVEKPYTYFEIVDGEYVERG